MSVNNNKKGSRIRTLRDMDLLQGSKSVDPKGYKNITGALPDMKIAHIPHLPQSDETIALLRRIHKEFFPIAQKRGYKVLSLSEMCCCGDGLDHGSESITVVGVGTKRHKGGRKRRVMASNILGYNQSRGNIHTIHLRMRHARNHALLLPYEVVAGTMSHELAHCVYGPHNAKFYKLMDEIQEQHAVFLSKGIVADMGGFPVGGQQSYVLGRVGTGSSSTATGGVNNPLTAAIAAEARRKKKIWMPGGPQALGGDATFRQWLTPGEAAAGAAEARRLQDEKWCLPCSNEPIDLLDSSGDEEEDDLKLPAAPVTNKDGVIDIEEDTKLPATTGAAGKPPRVVHRITPTNSTTYDAEQTLFALTDVIDLTGDSDDDDNDNDFDLPAIAATSSNTAGWTCSTCTFQNDGGNPLVLACFMCGGEKSSAASKDLISKLVEHRHVASEQLVSQLVRDDAIEQVKQTEVERAKKDFGFNIYGDTNQYTATLPHLT